MAKPNLFNSIKLTRPKKNVFDLTHDVKMSLDMGNLVPIMCMEAVPGDKFQLSCESLLRFAPLVSPVMHRMDVSMHYFFVPNRILWPDWEKWITERPDIISWPSIVLTDTETQTNKLVDYLGVPELNSRPDIGVSALPFSAYQAVYHEYYRDQNLVAEFDYKVVSGDNTSNVELTKLRRRAWEHDYFTAALPFAQKGTAVDLPIGTLNDVPISVKPAPGATDTSFQVAITKDVSGASTAFGGVHDPVDPQGIIGVSDLFAETSAMQAESATINDLRRAFRLQEWLEKNARAGTRYVESILAHFGVKSSDARLNRPEYITGTKSPVVISEVLNTTGTDDAPQGTMAGHGISVTSGKYGSYFAEEHGFIVGVMSVMPKTAYQQGLPKMFSRSDQFDYYWPEFANIGEQEVKNQEIYADQGFPGYSNTFGYVPRYSEYKYMPSRVCGDFKNTLDFWHLGRIFGSAPALNQAFIECDPGKRIFAVDSVENSLYAHVLNKVRAVRPMPKFGTPQF